MRTGVLTASSHTISVVRNNFYLILGSATVYVVATLWNMLVVSDDSLYLCYPQPSLALDYVFKLFNICNYICLIPFIHVVYIYPDELSNFDCLSSCRLVPNKNKML